MKSNGGVRTGFKFHAVFQYTTDVILPSQWASYKYTTNNNKTKLGHNLPINLSSILNWWIISELPQINLGDLLELKMDFTNLRVWQTNN